MAKGAVLVPINVVLERTGTGGRVLFAGLVFSERSGTNGGIVRSTCVSPERGSANCGVPAAVYVLKERSKTNGHVEVAVDVGGERVRPNGHVLEAGGVVGKRPSTNRHVKLSASIVSKRIGTHGGIVDPGGGRVQGAISHCGGTTATTAGALCFELRQKRKAEECDEKWWNCFELNQWIHGPSFLFPARLMVRLRIRRRRRNWRGKLLRLIQNRLATPSLAKITPVSQTNSPQAEVADSSSTNAVRISSERTM